MPRRTARARSARPRTRRYYNKGRMVGRKSKASNNKKMLVLGRAFPQKMMVTHRYVDQITLTCTSGVLATYLWSCNDMYDPNRTGGGHQPILYDQMTPLYNHWQVIGSRFRLKAVPHTSNTVTSNFACFVNDDTSFENTGLDGQLEQTGAKGFLVGTNAGGNRSINKSLFWSSKKKFGTNHLQNSRLQGASTTSPTEQSYYAVCLQSFDQLNSCQLQITVEIDYVAIWTEVRDVLQS